MATKIVGFNYDALVADVRGEAAEHASAIKDQVRRTTQSIIDIGRRLHRVKFLVGRNHFGAWLRAEFHWNQSVASNYMMAATKFGNLDEGVIDNFQPSALFSLGRSAIPEQVVTEAVDAARSGELVTYTEAQSIIRKHRTGKVTPDLVTVLKKYILKVASKLGANFVADKLNEIAVELRASASKVA